mgnify:CR=1 FL=1
MLAIPLLLHLPQYTCAPTATLATTAVSDHTAYKAMTAYNRYNVGPDPEALPHASDISSDQSKGVSVRSKRNKSRTQSKPKGESHLQGAAAADAAPVLAPPSLSSADLALSNLARLRAGSA